MKSYTIVVPAGVTFELAARGNYVRVKSAPVDCVIVNPDAQGDERVEASQGDDFEFSTFERLSISHASGAAQTFKFLVAKDKKSNSTPVSGATTITALPDTAMGASVTSHSVTTASSAVKIAKSTRRYLLIQNNDSSAFIRVQFNAVATATVGIRIPPGGSLELSSYLPNGSVNAIAESTPSGANNVAILEF